MLPSGRVFDLYDDPHGALLCAIYASADDLPESVKTAEALLPEELEALPDEAFAMVLREGGRTLRKYACVDAGHTALAAAYFVKTAHAVPPEVLRGVAERIKVACEAFGVEVPSPVEKLALGLGLARAALVAGPVAAGTAGSVKRNLAAVRQLEGAGRVVTPAEAKAASKLAEASGTDAMPAAPAPPPAAAFALRGRYPLQTAAQVKAASAYFEEHARGFVPEDRRAFACAVAARTSELGWTPSGTIRKYASDTYASAEALELAHGARRSVAPEHLRPALDALFEARPALPADLFARALAEFDKEAGLLHLHDTEIPDPYASALEAPARPTKPAGLRASGWVKHAARGAFVEKLARDPAAAEALSPRERAVLARGQ
jgi:hypothetical protein